MNYLTSLTKEQVIKYTGARLEEDMPGLQWNQRFFASTRGRIVMLLRRNSRTVEELAQILNLTDNAVRAHLATLERDGFIRQSGVRRGSGKPAYIYELSPDAEQLFPKAYGSILRQLLEVLREEMTTNEVEALMRRTGLRLAEQQHIPSGDLKSRLQMAVNVLNELGGLAELEQRNGAFYIQGYSCLLAVVVPGHPEACRLTGSLLTELVGQPVNECCDVNEPARCCFSMPTS
jgi:predicted ArsR family transcriptional regulator